MSQPVPEGTGPSVPSAQLPQQEPPRSGHPEVDAALDELADAAGLPPADQVVAFESAYRRLQGALKTIDA